MRRYGTTYAGTQRFQCKICTLTSTRKRPDTTLRHRTRIFKYWLSSKKTLGMIAEERGCHLTTLSRSFQSLFRTQVSPPLLKKAGGIFVLDAKRIHNNLIVLILFEQGSGILTWSFALSESYDSWYAFLKTLPVPECVVIDGHSGLLRALHELFPQVHIQRCHFHVVKRMRHCIKRNPKTEAGIEIRRLILELKYIHTPQAKTDWCLRYEAWESAFEVFLRERSFSLEHKRKHWWYTHRNLRAVRSLIRHAMPYLFTYLSHPHVPNTTNRVEGGINALLAEALRCHRGLRRHQKRTFVSVFLHTLAARKTKPTLAEKSTRNAN